MKKATMIGVWLVLIIASGPLASVAAAARSFKSVPMRSHSQARRTGRMDDRILVRFKTNAAAPHRAAALSRLGSTEKHEIPGIGVKILSVPHGTTPEEMVNRIRTQMAAEVEFVDVDPIWSAQTTPNDPLFSFQYHLSKLACSTAWNTTTGSGITIAIADTGVDPTHPDLAGHLTAGTNVAEGNSDTSDQEGHGTAVAGAAAAIGNNLTDVTGVAYNATLMPIKVVVGGNDSTDEATIAAAIVYAANQGVKVVNLSFGSDSCNTQTLLNAALYLRSRGGQLVQAAGNSGLNRGCPATPLVIQVSATDQNDALASFSNFGPDIGVAAPGESIVTTNCDGCTLGSGFGDVAIYSGTSFSAPIVSGVLALIYSIHPTFTADQAQTVLFDSADDLGTAGFDTSFGWGRVNAANAITLAQQRANTFTSQTLSNVYAYPNPWDIRRNGQRLVTIANVLDGASVRIFTLSGVWIKSLTPANGRATWDLTNDAGELVASGLYFYIVKTSDGNDKVRSTIAIIK